MHAGPGRPSPPFVPLLSPLPSHCLLQCIPLLLPAHCLDRYFELRVAEVDRGEAPVGGIDPRLVDVVERMLGACCEAGAWEQAVGVALEGRRLDQLEAVVTRSGSSSVLQYALRVAGEAVGPRAFRQQVCMLHLRAAPHWSCPSRGRLWHAAQGGPCSSSHNGCSALTMQLAPPPAGAAPAAAPCGGVAAARLGGHLPVPHDAG